MSMHYDSIERDVLNLENENLNQSFYEQTEEFGNEKSENFVFDNALSSRISESNGILTEEIIKENLSNLGPSADGTNFVYLNLTLPGFRLKDINALSKFKELQNLEISFNEIRDLSVLSGLPHLIMLNAANNKIEKLFDFLPPFYLKIARFSFNEITEIGNLLNFHYLQTLDLDHNHIEKIEGLEYCHRLQNLNLGHNRIRKIEGLANLPLIKLDLRSNHIKRIEGLEHLKMLRYLNLSGNMIRSLKGIPERMEFLESLELEDNKIADIAEIEYLLKLDLLRELNLHKNPIREVDDYRLSIIFKLPKLTLLDRRRVEPIEKSNANNLFHPTAEYIAARDHMTNLVFSFIQDHRVKESTLPNFDSPYPILILCGPEGCGRMEIARKLVEEYPDFFDFVVSHTTREQKHFERDKVDYNFVRLEEFEQDVTHGRFICCNEYLGNWYGIQSENIERISKQGLACVIETELEGLLSFKQTYFEPRCVLLMPLNKKEQMKRLIDAHCTENEWEVASNRTEWYAEYNRQHPGFFDAVIITDDLNEGYENLRSLVLTYLGMSQDRTKSAQGRPKTSDEIKRLEETFNKDLDIPRSGTGKSSYWLDSFLPSNTGTANRSQQSSHHSMESLSQLYNQSLRLKYGSAPAQLLNEGFLVEDSLKRRSANIRREIDLSNVVSVKTQLIQHISKQADRGSASAVSISQNQGTKSADFSNFPDSYRNQSPETLVKKPLYKGKTNLANDTPDSSDNEQEDDKRNASSLSSNSKRSSHVSSAANSQRNYDTQLNKIKLPPLEIKSSPTNHSTEKEFQYRNNNKTEKQNLVLPSLA